MLAAHIATMASYGWKPEDIIKMRDEQIAGLQNELEIRRQEFNENQMERARLTLELVKLKKLYEKCLKAGPNSIKCPICRTQSSHILMTHPSHEECCVCMDKKADIWLVECDHTCMCHDCFKRLVVKP